MLSFVVSIAFTGNAAAQFRYEPSPKPSPQPNISINEFSFFQNSASAKSEQISGLEGETNVIQPSHKSAFLAAMLSLALPGLGEYYVGDQIWRGIIFTAIEAGLWYERYHFLGRGDDSTNAFQAFSDAQWSPQIYAGHLDSLLTLFHPGHQAIDPNDFSQINKAEDSLNILGLQNFSHQLPQKGSQQYYEIISKYKQYRLGWRDYVYNGPDYYSPAYERAAFMRANMNYQYEIASDFLYGLFLNRILSAIDAALLAKDHNIPIHLEGELQQRRYPDGTMGFMPTAKLRYTF